MQINFRDIRDDQDPETVHVWRNRFRGSVVENNTIVHQSRRLSHAFELFIEPSTSDYTAAELGGRLMQEQLAETVVAGGGIRISRDPLIRVVNFEFIDPSVALEEVAHLIALGFNHDDVSDFRDARVTFRNEPFLQVATVAELIRQYIQLNGKFRKQS